MVNVSVALAHATLMADNPATDIAALNKNNDLFIEFCGRYERRILSRHHCQSSILCILGEMASYNHCQLT
jgi:hypothetical protein